VPKREQGDTYTRCLPRSVAGTLCEESKAQYTVICNKIQEETRTCENRVLRTFGHKRVEVTGGWRKLHNEELHNMYALSNVMVIKSRRMK
jgi:hypothetical protein